MDKIIIEGGHPLNGRIRVGGAKNAALPLLCASLLTEEKLTLTNLPHLADIKTLTNLLAQHGVKIDIGGEGNRVIEMTTKEITSTMAPYDLVRKMRASVLVLGPLVARCGEAKVSLPGGCAIGTRPIDLHTAGLEKMGAEIKLEAGYVIASAPNGLQGAEIVFPTVSVGATENLLMAACLAKGQTKLVNAAREPEVIDLAECLVKMGANIQGIGTDTLIIDGVEKLSGTTHRIVPDRIEAGTYVLAAAMAGGELTIEELEIDHVRILMNLLKKSNVTFVEEGTTLTVTRTGDRLVGVDVMTEPYPGFPTDLQAQIMAAMTVADGASMITETIFENRFMHVPELSRMGANINVHHSSALVRGVEGLKGAPVMATDLRASSSLVLAGLVADGETEISRVYHLDRGYEQLEKKLSACGAKIRRVKEAA